MSRISSARVSRSAGGLRVVAALAFLVAAGCHSLEVTNPNDPDLARALATGGDIESLLGGAFNKWYHAMQDVGPSVPLSVASDQYESCWGNWGMKVLGWEPRTYASGGLINSHTDAYDNFRQDIEEPWYNNYGALVSANLVIKALANGVKIPGPVDSSDNAMVLAAARFMQGAALSNIALNYDSGYAFDESYDPTTGALPLVGRDSVKKAAMTKLAQAITLSAAGGTNWTIPTTFLNQSGNDIWTKSMLNQVANYWAARTLAYFPHNAAEYAAVPWATVLGYAQNGITFDLNSTSDGGQNWWDDYASAGDAFFTWMRVDYRVVCLLDPTYKCHHSNDNHIDSLPKSPDFRFNGDDVIGDNCVSQSVSSYGATDATRHCTTTSGYGGADYYYPQYPIDWTGFQPARGFYRFSNVAHVRYINYGSYDAVVSYVGTSAFVQATDNDLLQATALILSNGSRPAAAALINKTRVTRGHLPALTGAEADSVLIAAISYERAVEEFGSNALVPWYYQRRMPDLNPTYYTGSLPADTSQAGWYSFGWGLQPGTPRILPVPNQELTLIGHPTYSYGGPNNPEGSAPVRSLFGTTSDGRVITGPGVYAQIADQIIAAKQPSGSYCYLPLPPFDSPLMCSSRTLAPCSSGALLSG